MSRTKYPGRAYPDLKTWRRAQGISQREAAKLLHISQGEYSRLERGAQFQYGEKAKTIIAVTGVPLEVIAGVL